ncbi:alpha/beta hydrolase [Streptomyces sp. 1331.2]|uniref:alpha/beta hydrolase n=1 Tax=Streptomyces sp. 1331.2 TaxID=1938835 RepID=UPI000BCA12CD|nr:alpha/beta hydrolase [Streptomyces sp. 1331.2]SOB84343.1 Alpha/beta hydrolase [Streptomyces sp. 1331.2]
MRRFRAGRTIAAAAVALAAVLGAGGWATDTQTPLTGPPPGTAAWTADTSLGLRLPDPATAAPAQVASFFAELPQDRQGALAARHPLVVGNLDGAPVALRYRANALALAAERTRELARATDPSLTPQDHEAARTRAERYRTLLDGDRQILAFDPRGRGQVAEVYGDLATARRTAVIVPGSDIDLLRFDRTADPYGTPAGMARALRAEEQQQAADTQTAVVAWAGYTTPVGLGVDAATEDLARAGATRLTRLLDGLAVSTRPEAPPTVFCHSYGSVVCGLAHPSPARASGLVVLGSPGMGVDSAADLDHGVPLWATARNGSDWIGDVPNVRLLGLGHGADPTAPGFGARPLPATGSHGHTGYFAPGTASLAAYAAVALGRG